MTELRLSEAEVLAIAERLEAHQRYFVQGWMFPTGWVTNLAVDWLSMRAENERLQSESLALRMALDNLEESSRALLEAEFAARFDAHWDHLDEQTKAARALLEKPL